MHATPLNFKTYNCSNVVQLVSGGEIARDGEFPHHALLGYNKSGTENEYVFRCGGTLISDRHVLTAAHCFKTDYPSIVRLGEYDLMIFTGYEYDVPIEGFLRHPEHDFGNVYNDIALVKLKNKVTFTESIRPACLWDTEIRNVSKFVASGFGYTSMYEALPTQMAKVVLEKFPKEDCFERLNVLGHFGRGIIDGQLCVGSNTEGRDTCEGDSGGPLQTVTDPSTCTFHVVGVISTGIRGCGVGKSRAVYTNVSHYLGWIEENVWGDKADSTDIYEAIWK
ncbi:hypothetical protein ZHAS_00001385 [Anopheles sinensis]|uniref:Peptidase S1 domain-containing protein n=1 Tax=Anopheles sinensis TaxID=74873 RepID=A0A084VB98_ANOSI|nr:hypothetical protein ZHAS_00001385 [Anopheles sinensis]